MKRRNICLIISIFFNQLVNGQINCVDFENSNTNSWTLFYIAGIEIEKSPDQQPSSSVLHLSDGGSPGWSVAVNNTDFSGNWLNRGRNNCLCFDYKIDWNTNIDPSAGTAPRLVIYTGPSLIDYNSYLNCLKAEFVGHSTAPPLQDNIWKNYCLPIASCSNTALPSNALGSWRIFNNGVQLTGTEACTAWNQIIQNVTGLMLVTDYNADPSEDVYFDNFCRTDCPVQPNRGCCPNQVNLIRNSDFNQPLAPVSSSQYILDGPITSNSTIPGEYVITDGNGASSICKNWIVQDRIACSASSGSFMIINGRTTQPSNTNNIIWEQNLLTSQKDSSYRFCAFFKNLPACCFDILPKIKIDIGSATTGWTTINAGPGPCSWQQVSLNFTGSGGAMVIRIYLDEMGRGDGNDLAIDDISVYRLPSIPFEIHTGISGNQITGSFGTNPGTSDDILVSPECNYVWTVGRFDINANTLMMTPSPGVGNDWNGWALTTNFPGYSFPPGTTGNPNYYLVGLTILGCECFAQTSKFNVVMSYPQGMRIMNEIKISSDTKNMIIKRAEQFIKSGRKNK